VRQLDEHVEVVEALLDVGDALEVGLAVAEGARDLLRLLDVVPEVGGAGLLGQARDLRAQPSTSTTAWMSEKVERRAWMSAEGSKSSMTLQTNVDRVTSRMPDPASARMGPMLWRLAPMIYGPTVLFALGEGAVVPLFPVIAAQLGADVPTAALVASALVVGQLCGNIPAGWAVSRIGERMTMIIGGVLALGGVAGCCSPRACRCSRRRCSSSDSARPRSAWRGTRS
jgi:hypothetical protein